MERPSGGAKSSGSAMVTVLDKEFPMAMASETESASASARVSGEASWPLEPVGKGREPPWRVLPSVGGIS